MHRPFYYGEDLRNVLPEGCRYRFLFPSVRAARARRPFRNLLARKGLDGSYSFPASNHPFDVGHILSCQLKSGVQMVQNGRSQK